MTTRAFLDTAVLTYAVGGQHLQRDPCLALVAAAGSGDLELHISAEAIQEFLFHRMRWGDRNDAMHQIHLIRELCVVHPGRPGRCPELTDGEVAPAVKLLTSVSRPRR